jgi:hypothetical protein
MKKFTLGSVSQAVNGLNKKAAAATATATAKAAKAAEAKEKAAADKEKAKAEKYLSQFRSILNDTALFDKLKQLGPDLAFEQLNVTDNNELNANELTGIIISKFVNFFPDFPLCLMKNTRL